MKDFGNWEKERERKKGGKEGRKRQGRREGKKEGREEGRPCLTWGERDKIMIQGSPFSDRRLWDRGGWYPDVAESDKISEV